MDIRSKAQRLTLAGLLAVTAAGVLAGPMLADTKGNGDTGAKSCYNDTTKRSTPNGQVEYVPLGDGVHSYVEGCDDGYWVLIGVVGARSQPPSSPVREVPTIPAGLLLGS
jgi:hypothetical protein